MPESFYTFLNYNYWTKNGSYPKRFSTILEPNTDDTQSGFRPGLPPPAKIYLYSKFSRNLAIITMSSACFIDLETALQGSSRNVLINVSAIWCLEPRVTRRQVIAFLRRSMYSCWWYWITTVNRNVPTAVPSSGLSCYNRTCCGCDQVSSGISGNWLDGTPRWQPHLPSYPAEG